MAYLSLASPLGPLTLFEDGGALVALEWGRVPGVASSPLLVEAKARLAAYFAGRRDAFELPLDPPGTPFQRALWRRLGAIPYGTTTTYGALARELATAPRAVGRACAANPLPIVIPCHRVLGADGRLGGYSGGDGVAAKRALLRLEGALS